MIDTHCHLNFPELTKDLESVLARARHHQVKGFVIPGTNLEDSMEAISVATTQKNVWAALGIHPTHEEAPEERQTLAALVGTPKVVAIGEVGLDYYHLPKDFDEIARLKAQQQERLGYFLRLAKKAQLPLIIHSRDCFVDMHRILRDEAPGQPFVIHCFSGDWAEAQKWLDLGGYLSFTAIVTYPKNAHLREVLAKMPWDRCMLETDAPFLPPQEQRGKRGEPQYVQAVASTMAAERHVSLEEVDRQTTATAERFFGITVEQ